MLAGGHAENYKKKLTLKSERDKLTLVEHANLLARTIQKEY